MARRHGGRMARGWRDDEGFGSRRCVPVSFSGIDLFVLAAELIEDGIVHPRSDDLAEVTFAGGFDGDRGGQGFDCELLCGLALGLSLVAQGLLEFVRDVAEDQGHIDILRSARGAGKARSVSWSLVSCQWSVVGGRWSGVG